MNQQKAEPGPVQAERGELEIDGNGHDHMRHDQRREQYRAERILSRYITAHQSDRGHGADDCARDRHEHRDLDRKPRRIDPSRVREISDVPAR